MFYKFLIAICALFPVLSTAQSWDPKNRSIELVVPYPPGGNSDRVARKVSEIMTAEGWKVIVVNRPGGDTVIGANYVAKAKPDGYTLYMGGNGFLDSNIAFKNQPPGIEYTKQSFTPIVPLGYTPLALVAPLNSPFSTYNEFKTYVRANPEKFNLGFWNSYTAKLFLEWARVEGLPTPNIVNYKGSTPQVQDLLNGQLFAAFDTQTTARQFSDGGKIKYISSLNDIAKNHPSIDLTIWYGLYAPAGIDPRIVTEINQVVNKGVAQKEIRDTFRTWEIYDIGGSVQKLERTQQKTFDILHNISKRFE